MCGILCLICLNRKTLHTTEELIRILKNRGPDINNSVYECNNLIGFYGFVLWQQGERVYSQPAVSEKHILLLNGDIFNLDKSQPMSDTEWLLLELDKCETQDDIIGLISSLKGPYSIIIYSKEFKILYFARDSLGRNSLIIERDVYNDLRITSTSGLFEKNNISTELPPNGIYKLQFQYNDSDVNLKLKNIELFSWKNIVSSQKENVENIFQVPCIVHAAQEKQANQLQIQSKQKYFNFYNIACGKNIESIELMTELIKHEEVLVCTQTILNLLKLSLQDRILKTPSFCLNCIKNRQICKHSKIGILFSGGLDCSILARLSHEICMKFDSIDLINVAFENINSKSEQSINWNTPDRISGLKSYEELTKLIPERNWNFVEVNVTRKELSSYLSTTIKHLIYPLNTVLDESLGASFWFASRGKGQLRNEPYQTPCRVILIGSGADELFGGYTRHRNAFTRNNGNLQSKIEAVGKEMAMDWDRIAFRNLGRDDRVIADNCKTARAPYIEENFVNFVTSLKPEQKCCYTLSQGVGDKLLLRLCGFKLGLYYSSLLQKRAIQFGSKIADKKQNAKDVSKYLVHSENQ